MSADLLRRAASLMRERAEAATRGPWVVDGYGKDGWQVNGDGTVFADCHVFQNDADHIASWHPAVALAVADWLEADATVIERHGLDVTVSKAYAVARAYLGSDQ